MLKKLSICIPTYNRAFELARLLEGLCAQVEKYKDAKLIEVIVGDNCSNDGTNDFIQGLQEQKSYLRYYKNDENKGYAFNINRVVSESAGEYCWLLGSDDVLIDDSINNIMMRLDDSADLILYDSITRDRLRKLHVPDSRLVYRISKDIEMVDFIDQCNEISGLFAFISAIVVKKTFWDSVCLSDYEKSHPYTHMLRLLHAVKGKPTVIEYPAIPIVATGVAPNDYTVGAGLHFLLDLDTFRYIETNVLTSRELVGCIRKLFKRQYSNSYIRKLKWRYDYEGWMLFRVSVESLNDCRYDLSYSVCDKMMNWAYLFAKGALRRPLLHL